MIYNKYDLGPTLNKMLDILLAVIYVIGVLVSLTAIVTNLRGCS